MTDKLIRQVRRTIEDHELVKIKLLRSAPDDLDRTAEELTSKVPCHLAQKIGKTALLFNLRKKDSDIVLPKTPAQKTVSLPKDAV